MPRKIPSLGSDVIPTWRSEDGCRLLVTLRPATPAAEIHLAVPAQ